jgi:hypothetical protein
MSAQVIDLATRQLAGKEGARLATFLAAVDAAFAAQAASAAFDTVETMDTTAARDALDTCLIAEDRVLALALDRDLTVFLRHVLDELNDVAGGAACA